MKQGLILLLLLVATQVQAQFYAATYSNSVERGQISPWFWFSNSSNKYNGTYYTNGVAVDWGAPGAEVDPVFGAWKTTNTYIKVEVDPVFTNWVSTNTSPYFLARNISDQTINDATWTKVLATNIITDTDSGYSVVNSRYIFPKVGQWLLEGKLRLDDLADTKFMQGTFYTNGVISLYGLNRNYSSVAGADMGLNISMIYDVISTSDYAEFYVYHDDTVARGTAVNWVTFTGKFLGE